jgi:hypothetical protein
MTILLWPIISSYRSIREYDYTTPISNSLGEAVGNLSYGTSSTGEQLTEGIKSILFRYGAISLYPIIGSDVEPLKTNIFNNYVTRFYTEEVLRYSPDHIHASGPSFIGWFYLVGGNFFVVLGVFLFMTLTWFLWNTLRRLQLKCLPVARSLLLLCLIELCGGGSLDRLGLHVLVLAGSIAACEYIIRKGSGLQIIKG